MSRTIPSIQIPAAPCRHVSEGMVYRPPPRRAGDRTFVCPCCGAVAYAAAGESLPACPRCDIEPQEVPS